MKIDSEMLSKAQDQINTSALSLFSVQQYHLCRSLLPRREYFALCCSYV